MLTQLGWGWHLYDGSSVSYLKSDGTTALITLDNLIGTSAYLKLGIANTAITSAVAPTITMEPTTGGPSGVQTVTTGSIAVASSTHTHTLSGGAISSTGEPVSVTRRPWFRQ